MLVEFRVRNYRSFAEEQVLSMEATRIRKLEQRNTFLAPDARYRLLHAAAIYGANASGKSNLILAMSLMRELVCRSAQEKDAMRASMLPVLSFRLDPALRDQPSRFEVTFFQEGVRYDYGFTIRERGGRQIIDEEWLYAYPRKRRRLWFKRQGQQWSYGPSFKGEKSKIQAMTRPDALFLSVGDLLNHPQLKPVYAWFDERFTVIPGGMWGPGWFTQETAKLLSEDEDFHRWVEELLLYADLGIAKVETQSQSLRDYVNDRFGKVPQFGEAMLAMAGKLGKMSERLYRIKTLHRRVDGQWEWFDLEKEESGGTQLFFGAASLLWQALRRPGVLVVDELDTSLHPGLLRLLVLLFQAPALTPPGAQLIFTTHDTSLLDPTLEPRLFRRDQIWFLEKDEKQASQLYSLADFDEREDASFTRRYLNGIYGAVPGLQVWLDALSDGLLPSEWPFGNHQMEEIMVGV